MLVMIVTTVTRLFHATDRWNILSREPSDERAEFCGRMEKVPREAMPPRQAWVVCPEWPVVPPEDKFVLIVTTRSIY